jgi:hypothetical protein
MSNPLEKLNAKVFAEHLNTPFQLQGDFATPITLELVAVNEGVPSPQIESFALHFRGPAAPRLPQQIYRMEHASLGTIELFLTAISAEPDQRLVYESAFNRFRKPAP